MNGKGELRNNIKALERKWNSKKFTSLEGGIFVNLCVMRTVEWLDPNDQNKLLIQCLIGRGIKIISVR